MATAEGAASGRHSGNSDCPSRAAGEARGAGSEGGPGFALAVPLNPGQPQNPGSEAALQLETPRCGRD